LKLKKKNKELKITGKNQNKISKIITN